MPTRSTYLKAATKTIALRLQYLLTVLKSELNVNPLSDQQGSRQFIRKAAHSSSEELWAALRMNPSIQFDPRHVDCQPNMKA